METKLTQKQNQNQDLILNLSMHANDKPVHVIRCGNIKAACWLNHGESGSFLSTSIARVYHDKSTDQWGQSHSFSDTRDLLTVAFVSQEMCRWISEQKRVDSVEVETDEESLMPEE